MNKAILIASATLLLSIGSEASEQALLRQGYEGQARIRSKHLITSHELGRVTLRHDGSLFTVQQGKLSHKVALYDTDPVLRKLNKLNLAYYLQNGRIKVSRLSDGSFVLRSNMIGLGAGPIAGAIAYWVTKSLCYGAATAAVGTMVALPATAAVAAPYVLSAAGLSSAVSGGAAIAGVAITEMGLASTASGVVVASVSAGGGIAGAVAAVESASIGAWAAFTAMPFLP